jgi:hypothetical protein
VAANSGELENHPRAWIVGKKPQQRLMETSDHVASAFVVFPTLVADKARSSPCPAAGVRRKTIRAGQEFALAGPHFISS